MATQPTTTHDEKEEAQSKPEAESSPSRHISALSEKDAEAGISTPQVSSASTTDVEAELELDQPLAPEHAHHDGIPNGGLQAWLQVVGSFFLFMNSWGIVNTFGVFQTYYETGLLIQETPSNISWIGSIQAFLLLLCGLFAGPLFDMGYCRTLIFSGSCLAVFGMFMTSISTAYWHVMLSQALCVGLGLGCLFVPSVAIMPMYFTSRKALATGIGAAGSSLGGVIYPIVFHQLEPRIGFGWATRVLAFMMLATLSISLLTIKVRIQPQHKRKMFDMSALTDLHFMVFTGGAFFVFMGLYIPFFYVQTYALSENIMDANLAFFTLTFLNASSIFGRIIPGRLADRFGPLNVLIPVTLGSAVLAFGWSGIHSTAGLIVFCILYGFCSGGFVSLPPTVLVHLTPDMALIGTRMGMSFAINGLGLLCGTPVAGTLVLRYGFEAAILYCGVLVAVGGLCFVLLRYLRVGGRVKAKI